MSSAWIQLRLALPVMAPKLPPAVLATLSSRLSQPVCWVVAAGTMVPLDMPTGTGTLPKAAHVAHTPGTAHTRVGAAGQGGVSA